MKAKGQQRFDLDALRDLAGARSFARGEAYFHDDQVVILSIDRKRVLAQVAGTEDYRTEVTGRGKEIGGECSCRAFEDWGFCKHMVATALAANAAGGEAEADGAGALSRIRRHLKKKGIDALVEMIVEVAEHDPALFHRLDTAAAMVDADDKTIEARLHKAIDGATRTRDFIDYKAAAGWAKGVDAALDAVANLVSGGRAGLALKLAERAIDRIEQAVGAIDDSDGHCGALLNRARDIHLAAARAARPAPVAFARDLFDRELEGDYDTFAGATAVYAEVLGEEGLAEYRRLAAEAWAKLPLRAGATRDDDGALLARYDRLKGILDVFAEGEGDIEARIALRAKDLSSPWHYLQLAEFCREQGRKQEALRRAEEGLWIFEDSPPYEPLVLFAVGLLSKAGRKGDAEAQLWRAFAKAPSLELYTRLRRLAGQAARERAVEWLEGQLAQKTHSPWLHIVDLLVDILLKEKLFDAAWAAVRKHGASSSVRDALARASEATHPREALETYAKRIELCAGSGQYMEAASLIARIAPLRSAAEHTAYVAALKLRFGRKRNFMKLLG